MRRFVEPPPSARCASCNGWLTLKKIDTTRSGIGITANVFACTSCAREQSVAARQDLYAAPSSGNVRPAAG